MPAPIQFLSHASASNAAPLINVRAVNPAASRLDILAQDRVAGRVEATVEKAGAGMRRPFAAAGQRGGIAGDGLPGRQ